MIQREKEGRKNWQRVVSGLVSVTYWASKSCVDTIQDMVKHLTQHNAVEGDTVDQSNDQEP